MVIDSLFTMVPSASAYFVWLVRDVIVRTAGVGAETVDVSLVIDTNVQLSLLGTLAVRLASTGSYAHTICEEKCDFLPPRIVKIINEKLKTAQYRKE